MAIDKLSEQECIEVLVRATVGRLGCSLNDQPYVVPVYLACEADSIYVFSTLGKKIEWMRANPKVCVEIDEISSQTRWVSVIVNGTYQELPEPQFQAERAHARKLLQQKHQWWLNALAERRREVEDLAVEPLFFRIHVESMSGLRSAQE